MNTPARLWALYLLGWLKLIGVYAITSAVVIFVVATHEFLRDGVLMSLATALRLYQACHPFSDVLAVISVVLMVAYLVLSIIAHDSEANGLVNLATAEYQQHAAGERVGFEGDLLPDYTGRLPTIFRSRVTFAIAAAIRLRMSTDEDSTVNRIAARRVGAEFLREERAEGQPFHGLRNAHAAMALNAAVELVFIPTDEDIMGHRLRAATTRLARRAQLVGSTLDFHELLHLRTLLAPRQAAN